jgi:transcriptional regulator with XRE-family HTH domain
VATDKTPTEFGFQLLKLMTDVGLRPTHLARAAGIGGSTLSRYIYGEVDRPDSATLARIARALVVSGNTPAIERETAVEQLHNRLLHAAGYRIGDAPPARTQHPLVVELDQMIGEGTPLTDAEIKFLEEMVGRLVDPYRRKIRKRTG